MTVLLMLSNHAVVLIKTFFTTLRYVADALERGTSFLVFFRIPNTRATNLKYAIIDAIQRDEPQGNLINLLLKHTMEQV